MRYVLFVLFLVISWQVQAQLSPQSRPDIYPYLVDRFNAVPQGQNDIVFIGNSITFWADWNELTGDPRVINMGIPGDHTYGILGRIESIVSRKPAKIFLMVGINDLAGGLTDQIILSNFNEIIEKITKYSPETQFFIQSILPTNPKFGKLKNHYGHEKRIIEINYQLGKLVEAYPKGTFVDLYDHFLDDEGYLDKIFTWDGVHLTLLGYKKWSELLLKNNLLQPVENGLLQVDENMKNKALSDLNSLLFSEEKWIKVHVAEFLIWKNQNIEAVRKEFLKENEISGHVSQYRIGIWRVLAQAASSETERNLWIDKIRNAYLDLKGSDRLHAIETLAKLKVPIMDPSWFETLTDSSLDPFGLYQLWNFACSSKTEKAQVIERLISFMEKNYEDPLFNVNMLVSSYILRSFFRLPIQDWEKIFAIYKAESNNISLKASLVATLWLTRPDSVPFDIVFGLREEMREISTDIRVVNHYMMAMATRSQHIDGVDIQTLFDRLRTTNSEDYDADLHASSAYMAFSFTQ